MISQDRNAFPCNVMQTNQAQFRFCQVKNHVQTACESHDLSMDSCIFNQPRATNFIQEYMFEIWIVQATDYWA